jgi:hypothetical protein
MLLPLRQSAEASMSTALITALRESYGYLRDGGYDQTAQLMILAADEIERLNREVQALEARANTTTAPRGAIGRLRRIVKGTRPAARLTGTVSRENCT